MHSTDFFTDHASHLSFAVYNPSQESSFGHERTRRLHSSYLIGVAGTDFVSKDLFGKDLFGMVDSGLMRRVSVPWRCSLRDSQCTTATYASGEFGGLRE